MKVQGSLAENKVRQNKSLFLKCQVLYHHWEDNNISEIFGGRDRVIHYTFYEKELYVIE